MQVGTMSKIAIISDVHSNIHALNKVLEEIGDMKIYCCGDLVGYNPFPNEVIEVIKGRDIVTILGNHDDAVITGNTWYFNPIAARAVHWTRGVLTDENMDFLKSLPEFFKSEDFFMFHGSPRDQLNEYVSPDYPDGILKEFLKDVPTTLILGHTHMPYIKKFDEKTIFNPGAVGQPRDYDPRAAYAIYDTEKHVVEIKRAEYDVDKVSNEILEQGLPKQLAYRLHTGY
ncbi:MAG: metallophosphoesterase family protein [Candidatus Hydrothermarchaeales archaeon]